MTSGMDLRKALRAARKAGCLVVKIKATGEVRVSHPKVRITVRVNGRRKDAPRALTNFIKKVGD
jgi:hypothetical protein